ncbi:hypothetical protein STENM223S_09194 [Streptomyces tendae]
MPQAPVRPGHRRPAYQRACWPGERDPAHRPEDADGERPVGTGAARVGPRPAPCPTGPSADTGYLVKLGAVHHFPFNSPCADALRTAHRDRARRGRRPGAVHARGADGRPRHRGWASPSSPAPRAASRSATATVTSRSNWRRVPPSASTTPALTAASTNARWILAADPAPRPATRRRHRPGHGLPRPCPATRRAAAPARSAATWFDVHRTARPPTALVVGDVMGRGLRAAVAMVNLRTAVLDAGAARP